MNPLLAEDSPEVLALRGTISLLTLIMYAEAGVIVAISGFFVAWIRKLYDDRLSEQAKLLEDRDGLLERVLAACSTLAQAVTIFTSRKGG